MTRHSDCSEAVTAYPIDLHQGVISISDAQHLSAFSIIRKQSFRRLLGYVYFLEKKSLVNQPSLYALFGGGIEFKKMDERDPKDEKSSSAMAREIGEEIGTESNVGKREFKAGDFGPIASLLGKVPDGRETAIDLWEMKDHVAERIHRGKIVSHQRKQQKELQRLQNELDLTTSAEVRLDLELEIRKLKEIMAGPPIRVRRFLGIWIQLRWALPLPIPIRIRPDWSQFFPIAAYALINDAMVRERQQ